MRYQITESPWILGQFVAGDTVTITIYDLSDSSAVTLDSNSCSEVGTTGIFKWNTSDIGTQPTEMVEYLWIMSNGTTDQRGKIVLGGYVDNLGREISIISNNTQPACEPSRGDDVLRTESGEAIADENDSNLTTI